MQHHGQPRTWELNAKFLTRNSHPSHTLPSDSNRLHAFVSITAYLPAAAEPSCSASHHPPHPPGFPIRPCRPPPRVSWFASFPLAFRS